MPKYKGREPYVEWSSIAIPKMYLDQIDQYLRKAKTTTSISEFVREAIKEKLQRDIRKG